MKLAQRIVNALKPTQENSQTQQEDKVTNFLKKEVPFLTRSYSNGKFEVSSVAQVFSWGTSTRISVLFRETTGFLPVKVWLELSSKDFEGPTTIKSSQKDITSPPGTKIPAMPKKEYKTYQLALDAVAVWIKKNEKGFVPKE